MKIISGFLSISLVLLTLFDAAPARAQGTGQTPSPQAKPSVAAATATPAAKTTPQPSNSPQRIVSEGIAIEFQVEPAAAVASGGAKPTEVLEAEQATIRFKVNDTATKTPVTGLNLSAWMSLREGEKAPEAAQCKEKVQAYMQGSLRARPEVDLNAYYLLALNKEANISVIDPLLGFGGSKLLTLIMLRSPGEDWALTSNRSRLFVSMPFVNQVAIVDSDTWKVVSNVDTGTKPSRVALQPDEKYLWVGNDGVNGTEATGVSVIDTTEMKKVADIATGAGHHEIAFSPDSRYAFVTNRQDGTLSVIDVAKLVKLKDVKVGSNPVSVAFSPLSKALYVVDETGGGITAVDTRAHTVLARMQAKPGARVVRFATGGRYGFALNPKENAVNIFDASTNRLLHTVAIGKSPDQIAFTANFAYVRSAGSEEVQMIRLSTVGKELDILHFPGGQLAPEKADSQSFADVIVPAPEGNAVLVANPADKQIYYYTEGMAAPMGNFQNYRREPRSVMVVDRSLRELTPGVYSTTVKLPKSGIYDVAFLSDSPRVIHCFDTSAKVNPAIKRERAVALRLEYALPVKSMRVGESFKIRFKLFDTATGQPKDGLKDVRVLTFLAPGIWQTRAFAQSVGAGVYETTVTPPQEGVYMIFVESASQGIAFRQLPHTTVQATAAAATTSGTTAPTAEGSKP